MNSFYTVWLLGICMLIILPSVLKTFSFPIFLSPHL